MSLAPSASPVTLPAGVDPFQLVYSGWAVPCRLKALDLFLRTKSYAPISRLAVLHHAAEHGTTEGCDTLEAEDAAGAEACLPWDCLAWTMSPDAEDVYETTGAF